MCVCVSVYVYMSLCVSMCGGGYIQVCRCQKRLSDPSELELQDLVNYGMQMLGIKLQSWTKAEMFLTTESSAILHQSWKARLKQAHGSPWLWRPTPNVSPFNPSDSSFWLTNRALAGWLHVPLHSFAETQACKDGRYCMYMLLCVEAQVCECMWSPKYNHGCLLQPLLLVPWLSLSLEFTDFTRLASQWVPEDPWVSTH